MAKLASKPSPTHPNADAFPHGMSGPALLALAHAGITTMAKLSQWTEADVAALHGIGPKALRQLREGLATLARHFRRA